MKPTSIIFIVLSLILIVTGYVGCEIATSMADSEGVSLYNEQTDEDGNRINTLYYNSTGYDRLELNISDATIYLCQGEEEKVVLKNFTEGSFTIMESGVSYIISDNISAVDMITSGNFNLTFKGLRHYWHDREILSKDKEVYVYAKDATVLNSIDLQLVHGKVVVENFKCEYDVMADVTDGEVLIKNSSAAAFNVSGNKCDLTTEATNTARFHTSIANGKIVMKSTDVTSLSKLAITNEGSVDISLDGAREDYIITAYASKHITLNGKKYDLAYPPENEDGEVIEDEDSSSGEATGTKTLDVAVTSGTVTIKTN